MSLLKTVRNRTKSQYAANRIAGRFAPSQTTHAATVAGHNLVIIDGRTVPAAGVAYADIGNPVAVVNSGSAGIAAYSANGSGIAVQFAGGGGSGGSGGGMEVHDLNSVWHTGTLADAQAPQFLKHDGTRQLTGNLSVAAGITIDGIDIGSPGAGLTTSAGQYTIASTLAGAGLTYAAGVMAVGAGNGITVNADNVALTTPGTVGKATSNSASGSHTHATEWTTTAQVNRLLALDARGYTAAVKLTVGTIDTASGALTLTPATYVVLSDDKAIRTASYASGFAGNGAILDHGISETAKTSLEVDNITVRGRMRVYELLIHQIRATNGSIFVSSTGKAKTVTAISGGFQIVTDTDHGFLTGDLIRAQRWTGSGTYVCNLTVTTVFDLTTFNAAYVSGDDAAVGMEFVRLGSSTDTDRQGSVYMTADDSGAPFIDVVDDIGSHAQWNTAGKVKVRLGQLNGIFSEGDEYGLYAGQGTTDASQYLRMSSVGVKLNNVPLTLWTGGQQKVNIDAGGVDVWIGKGSSDKRLSWDGTTLTVNGAINVTGGNAAKADLTNITGDLDDIPNGSIYARVNTTLITGGNIRVGSGTKDNTTTDPLYGWHIGSAEIVGQAAGVDQVVMDTTGKIKFGAGNGVLDASGVALYYDAATTPAVWSRITWYNTPATRTTEIGSIAFGDDNQVYAPEKPVDERGHALRIKSTNAETPSIYLQSTTNSYTVWHDGNDGASSGLDADLLDGTQGSAYAKLSGAAFTGNSSVAGTFAITQNGQGLSIIGTDHSYVAWYPDGAGAGRKAYFGFGSTLNDNLTFMNEAAASLILGTNSTARLTIDSAGAVNIPGDLTTGGAIGGTWSTMTTLSGQTEISGRAAQTRRLGDITFLRGAINPADDTGPIDLVQIATTTHRPTRTQYLLATALNDGTEPTAGRQTMHLKIHTDGTIECMSNTSSVQLISFDGLFFFNA